VIEFVINGEPHGKGRARSFVRNGHVGHYTPEKTASYEKLVAQTARIAMNRTKPFEGAVELSVFAVRSIPASWPKKRRAAALNGVELPTSKPDLDNIVKSIKDGCNGIAWIDDSQVVLFQAAKAYGANPHVRVQIKSFGGASVA
jgi:Holliday junction resolvase RusA-like endonuclease